MTNDDILPALITLVSWILIGIAAYKLLHRKHDEEPEIDDSFDLMSTAEKIEDMNRLGAKIEAIEQLGSDLEALDPRYGIINIDIRWMGRDNKDHIEEFWCDGVNTNTELFRELVERRGTEMRQEMAHKIAILYHVSAADCTAMRDANELKTTAGEGRKWM